MFEIISKIINAHNSTYYRNIPEVIRLVTHKNCADGLGSAIVVQDAVRKLHHVDLDIEFIQYGTPGHANLKPTKDMLFCDMTPPRDRVEEFVEVGAWCLDHHKRAEDIVAKFGSRGVFADEDKEPGVSGAVLAYRHVWMPIVERVGAEAVEKERMFLFSTLCGVYDTFQKSHPLWYTALELQAMMLKLPRSFWLNIDLQVALGMAEPFRKHLMEDQRHDIEEYFSDKRYMTATDPNGTKWCVFLERGSLVSKLADHARILGFPASCGVSLTADAGIPKTIVSLRSDGTVDVGRLASSNGGSGHTRAAGFTLTGLHDPIALLQKTIGVSVERP